MCRYTHPLASLGFRIGARQLTGTTGDIAQTTGRLCRAAGTGRPNPVWHITSFSRRCESVRAIGALRLLAIQKPERSMMLLRTSQYENHESCAGPRADRQGNSFGI